jgi:hypothetical protein
MPRLQTFTLRLVALGVALVAMPNLLLRLVGIPATDEPWIRVLGLVAASLGVYYEKDY